MIKKMALIVTIFGIVAMGQMVSADTIVSDVIQVRVPPNIYIYNETTMVITLIDIADGNPVLHQSSNITCFVRDPDGYMMFNGTHPAEMSNGIYEFHFTIADKIGTYVCWAKVHYLGEDYLNAALFEARYDPYTNLTSVVLRMGETISLINWETQNNTQQIVSHIGEMSTPVEKTGANAEKFNIITILRTAAEQSLMQYLFMTLFVIGIFIFATFIYGRQKGKKIAQRAATLPTTFVEAFE